uniref:Uncharacterized protein n=1 Tax=Arion vulgaris TaxID=1028688 RepID=A0A0B7BEB3_9EUPU
MHVVCQKTQWLEQLYEGQYMGKVDLDIQSKQRITVGREFKDCCLMRETIGRKVAERQL